MRLALACAAVSAAWAGECPTPADAQAWRVRSVRPETAATRELIGQRLNTDSLAEARRSFDTPPGSRMSISVTVVYLEGCEAGEADVVFRPFRFRLPHSFRLFPAAGFAEAWARGGVDWRRDWWNGKLSSSYSAGLTSEGLQQTGSIVFRSRWVEGRVAAGNALASARLLTALPSVWTRPFLPATLRDQPDFRAQLSGALASAESMLRITQYARDPAFRRIVRGLEALDRNPTCLPPSFLRRLRSALRESEAAQYGLVDALLAIEVAPDCHAEALQQLRIEFVRIDRAAAARVSAREIAALRELSERLLFRTPLIAIRPVLTFEASFTERSRSLLGFGGGLRVSLLNWLEATAGISWPRARPFIEMRFRDPLE